MKLYTDSLSIGGYNSNHPAMVVTGIHHVSIVATDLDLSRRFYTEVLGLREIPRPATFDFVVVWYDLGTQHIHLVPRETADAPSPRHFALQVDDAAAAREHFGEVRRGDARDDPDPRMRSIFRA